MVGLPIRGWALPATGGHPSAVGVTGIGRTIGDNIPDELPSNPVTPGLQILIRSDFQKIRLKKKFKINR
jgi:hypothetical protein